MLKRVFPFFASGGSNGPKAWSKGGYLYTPVPNLQTSNLPVPVFSETGNNISGVNSYDLIKEPNPSLSLILNYKLYGDISPNPNNSPVLQFPPYSLAYDESESKICCLRCTDNGGDSARIELLLRTSGAKEQKANIILMARYLDSMATQEPAYRAEYISLFGDRTPEQVEQFLNTYGLAPLAKEQEYVASQVPPDSELARTVVVLGDRESFCPSSYQNAFIFSFDIWSLEGINNTTLPDLHNKYPNQSVSLGPEYRFLMGNDIIYEVYRDNISKSSELYTKCFANPEIKKARNIGVFVQSQEF